MIVRSERWTVSSNAQKWDSSRRPAACRYCRVQVGGSDGLGRARRENFPWNLWTFREPSRADKHYRGTAFLALIATVTTLFALAQRPNPKHAACILLYSDLLDMP